ncbi:MAG: hypothetical protein KC416_14760 [Myxococcales bacterium]|nr:hypothetical protein [Myxococcales bacterium]
MTIEEKRIKARRRALRTAQMVTIGLAMAGVGTGCTSRSAGRGYTDNTVDPDGKADLYASDAAPYDDSDGGMDGNRWVADAGQDAGADGSIPDGSVGDAMAAEGGTCVTEESPFGEYECCREHGWDYAWGCVAWGPYLPPSEHGETLSRSETLTAGIA